MSFKNMENPNIDKTTEMELTDAEVIELLKGLLEKPEFKASIDKLSDSGVEDGKIRSIIHYEYQGDEEQTEEGQIEVEVDENELKDIEKILGIEHK